MTDSTETTLSGPAAFGSDPHYTDLGVLSGGEYCRFGWGVSVDGFVAAGLDSSPNVLAGGGPRRAPASVAKSRSRRSAT